MESPTMPSLKEISQALREEEIDLETYFDTFLGHVEVDNEEDPGEYSQDRLIALATDDPVSGAFALWILDGNAPRVEEKDVHLLKDLLLACWSNTPMSSIQSLNYQLEKSTSHTKLSLFSSPLLQVAAAVSLHGQNPALLSHLVSFTPPKETIFDVIDLVRLNEPYLSVEEWTLVLNSPWIHRPATPDRHAGWMVLLGKALSVSPEPEGNVSACLKHFLQALKAKSILPSFTVVGSLILSAKIPASNLEAFFDVFSVSYLRRRSDSTTATGPFSSPNGLLRAAALTLQDQSDKCEVLTVLLDNGLDPNWMEPIVSSDDPRCSSGSGPRDGSPERSGATDRETALHIAVSRGEVEVVRLLVRRGAKPALKDGLGRTAADRVDGDNAQEIRNALTSGKRRSWRNSLGLGQGKIKKFMGSIGA